MVLTAKVCNPKRKSKACALTDLVGIWSTLVSARWAINFYAVHSEETTALEAEEGEGSWCGQLVTRRMSKSKKKIIIISEELVKLPRNQIYVVVAVIFFLYIL
ncbi:hypothetical protein Btru_030485 [Bulinus truncatus]|nr:hypothetical protein Btru_030485 [Bulinus truncatus]